VHQSTINGTKEYLCNQKFLPLCYLKRSLHRNQPAGIEKNHSKFLLSAFFVGFMNVTTFIASLKTWSVCLVFQKIWSLFPSSGWDIANILSIFLRKSLTKLSQPNWLVMGNLTKFRQKRRNFVKKFTIWQNFVKLTKSGSNFHKFPILNYRSGGAKQARSTLRLNVPGLGWLFSELSLQHPNRSQ